MAGAAGHRCYQIWLSGQIDDVMLKPWHEMKCSLHVFRELVPVRCQNLFGKLESQSTGGLTGEEKILIAFREDGIFW